MSVHHRPAEPVPLGAAVLLAGFSHPMCDVDYFMSKLARQLARNGLFVAQVDPRGHGDSPGDFADVDLDTLRRDIELIVDHYLARFPGNLLCMGRGLTASLLAEVSAREGLLGVAGVAPYCIPPQVIQRQWTEVDTSSRDAFTVFPGNDYVAHKDFSEAALCTLHALGAVPYNLHGLRLSERFLEGLAQFDALPALQRAEAAHGLWLTRDERDPTALTTLRFDASSTHPPLATYRDAPLSRHPAFHRTVISRLTEWALDRCVSS